MSLFSSHFYILFMSWPFASPDSIDMDHTFSLGLDVIKRTLPFHIPFSSYLCALTRLMDTSILLVPIYRWNIYSLWYSMSYIWIHHSYTIIYNFDPPTTRPPSKSASTLAPPSLDTLDTTLDHNSSYAQTICSLHTAWRAAAERGKGRPCRGRIRRWNRARSITKNSVRKSQKMLPYMVYDVHCIRLWCVAWALQWPFSCTSRATHCWRW